MVTGNTHNAKRAVTGTPTLPCAADMKDTMSQGTPTVSTKAEQNAKLGDTEDEAYSFATQEVLDLVEMIPRVFLWVLPSAHRDPSTRHRHQNYHCTFHCFLKMCLGPVCPSLGLDTLGA